MTLATLVVKLGAETLEFHREMEKAAERFERVGRRMARAGREITKIFAPITVLAVAALTAAIKQSALVHGKLAESWELLALRSRQLLREVGAALTPAFIRLVEAKGGLIYRARQLVEWFTRLSPATQDLIIKVGVFLAVLGPTILVVGELIKGFAALWKIGLWLASLIGSVLAPVFAFLLSPIGLVILAVGLLIAGVALLIRHWALVKQKGLEVWAALKLGVIDTVDDMLSVLVVFARGWDNLWQGIVRANIGVVKEILWVARTLASLAHMPGVAERIDSLSASLDKLGVNLGTDVAGKITALQDGLGVMRLGALRSQEAIDRLGRTVERLPLLPDWLRNLPKWFMSKFSFKLPSIALTPLHILESADTLAVMGTKLKEAAQQARAFGTSFDFAGTRAQIMRTAIDELIGKGIKLNDVVGANGQRLSDLALEFRKATLESQLYLATQKSLVDAFTAIGQQFGNILGGIAHGFHDFGNVIKQLLGNMLVAVGQTLIAFGTAGLAIKAFVHNPFGAIAAGIALVALGTALAGAAQRALDASAAGMPGSRPEAPTADAGSSSSSGPAAPEGTVTVVIPNSTLASDPNFLDQMAAVINELGNRRLILEVGTG